MPEIVGQGRQPVIGDLGIGRVQIDKVDIAGLEPAIGEVVVEPGDVGLWQPIAVAQAPPAVAAIDELVGKAERQVGMGAQIRDSRDPQRRRALRAHPHRVGVVEPERRRHADAVRGER